MVEKQQNAEPTDILERARARRGDARPSLKRRDRTINSGTIEQYFRRGELLTAKYRRENRLNDWQDFCPSDVANWLISQKPNLKSATWRFYRTALSYFLSGLPGQRATAAVALLEADAAAALLGARQEGKRTSSLKQKSIPIEHYKRLTAYLSKSRSSYASVALTWLRAGLLTALRPAEWRATECAVDAESGRRLLRVLNAKATNGRGTGLLRTIDISNFPDDAIQIVQKMSALGAEWERAGIFPQMQEQCAGCLYEINQRLWPRRKYHYTLYSTRHQAIANFKSLMSPAFIAAIVGHVVTATAATHYGKKRSAWAPKDIPTPPVPIPEEVAIVRDQLRRHPLLMPTAEPIVAKSHSPTKTP